MKVRAKQDFVTQHGTAAGSHPRDSVFDLPDTDLGRAFLNANQHLVEEFKGPAREKARSGQGDKS
jgi:hypothetical protein